MERLTSADLPQADAIDRVVDAVRAIALKGTLVGCPQFPDPRDRHFYAKASQLLGFVDGVGRLTRPGRVLAKAKEGELRDLLELAFANSRVGSAWLKASGVVSIKHLDPSTAAAFLREHAQSAPSTLERRAQTLRSWVQRLHSTAVPKRSLRARKKSQQIALAGYDAYLGPPVLKYDWPSPQRFPHNEAGSTVDRAVVQELREATDILIVTGYASLEQVIRFLAARPEAPRGTREVRLLFGTEPFLPSPGKKFGGKPLRAEVRDYWLRRGISILLCEDVARAIERVQEGAVEVRIAPSSRRIHAKIYVSDRAASLGSSNFTEPGLRIQGEANVRFTPTEKARFTEARQLAEGFWLQGEDYKDDFISLLEELLQWVTWQQALARACAALLEGDWAQRYLPAEHLRQLRPPLWPHQVRGIVQALWIVENVGSALVADATGSGKTRMGAWLVRAVYDRCVRATQTFPFPAVISPPQVRDEWRRVLDETRLGWDVRSHGPLSNPKAVDHEAVLRAVAETDLLAVDEAHNFFNASQRTRRLVGHYADNAILFTATPINKGTSDLLALVDLLGADNLSERCLDLVAKFRRRRALLPEARSEVAALREEIRKFCVRRTRRELNEIADASKEHYRLPNQRHARYPAHRANFYECPATREDLELARQIDQRAAQLLGISRIGKTLEVPLGLNLPDDRYLSQVRASARALARYHVLKCMRSSRAALLEHLLGTAHAIEVERSLGAGAKRSHTGNVIASVERLAGQVPEWKLKAERASHETWLWDPAAHREACEREVRLYGEIAALAERISPEREDRKLRHLQRLLERHEMVLAFDSHVLTLALFDHRLREAGVNAVVFIGAGGTKAKRRAKELLGPHSAGRRLIALCSDAFSEGLNLQGASTVVHLDTPTVIRTAEQRAGRVDRMDSRHDVVEVWWPKDPPEFAPRRADRIRERHEMVKELIGANLQLPREEDLADERPLEIEAVAREASIEVASESAEELYDAFRPVRALIGRDGLVSEETYQEVRDTKAQIIACVGLLKSPTPWAFLAVGGLDRAAPRWLFFDAPMSAPRFDLSDVAAALRARLASGAEARQRDARAGALIRQFVERLRGLEQEFLPPRRKRALQLLEHCLETWTEDASRKIQRERVRSLRSLRSFLFPGLEQMGEPFADPRSVADAWLRILRPRIRDALASRTRRRRPWRLDDLEPLLQTDPVPLEELTATLGAVPLIEPIERRVVAMIVGVDEP
jgi:superfamily II DNA or RNA helicase